MKLQFTFLCRDIDAQLAFYRGLLDLPEAVYTRSASFRSVHTPEFLFGFHAAQAQDALGLAGRSRRSSKRPLQGYPTFLLDRPQDVDSLCERAGVLGGVVIRTPFATPYGQWQCVLEDPEGNLVRLSCEDLPEADRGGAIDSPLKTPFG